MTSYEIVGSVSLENPDLYSCNIFNNDFPSFPLLNLSGIPIKHLPDFLFLSLISLKFLFRFFISFLFILFWVISSNFSSKSPSSARSIGSLISSEFLISVAVSFISGSSTWLFFKSPHSFPLILFCYFIMASIASLISILIILIHNLFQMVLFLPFFFLVCYVD